jgi:KaiC/GvpD/RAD55 family RecA-like ATPase
MVKLEMGIKGFDELISDGIESSSRNNIRGPLGTGRTVFAMQFLWQGLQVESITYDVMDNPFPRLRADFNFFGWNIKPYEKTGRFIAIQAFPHFNPYPKDPKEMYYSLEDLYKIKRIDKPLLDKNLNLFVIGGFSEQILSSKDLEHMETVEDWSISCCHFYNIVNARAHFDVMKTATQKEIATTRAIDLDKNKAHNILFSRSNEETHVRELRITKMEGSENLLDWIPFEITSKGIELLKE